VLIVRGPHKWFFEGIACRWQLCCTLPPEDFGLILFCSWRNATSFFRNLKDTINSGYGLAWKSRCTIGKLAVWGKPAATFGGRQGRP
jgi:hypothetical protein